MALERLGAQHEMAVVDKFVEPVANYTMTERDYVVRPDATAGPITVTLPPVAKAKGRFYSIFIKAATGTNTVTLVDNNSDSERWFLTGIPFNERGQGVIVYSDGMRWNVMPQGIMGAQFSSARVDAVATIHAGICQLIMTGASALTQSEAFRASLTSNVQLGNWACGICAVIDLQTVGHVTGLIGVVCAELNMPAGAVPGGRGTYWAYEAEINLPTNYVGGGVPMAVIGVNVWGAAKTQFDTSGFLFDINGPATTASGFFYLADLTVTKADGLLKIRINGVTYYMFITTAINGGD
jgi:hypothetical protein